MILLHANVEAFLAVADLRSVSAAAKRLGLTQTGVTQRIKSLENEAGVALFLRSRAGMRLTGEGEAFLRFCLEAKGLEGRLSAEIKQSALSSDANLTIVGPASLIGGRVVRQCRHIFQKWPRLNMRFFIDTNANRLNHLKRGTADLAIVLKHEVTPELDSKLLKPLEFIMVAHPDWKRRALKDLLENERMFAYHPGDSTGIDYLKNFDLLDCLKRPRLFANENQVLQNLLCAKVGFGFLPRELAAPLIDSKVLAVFNGDRALKIEVALTWFPRPKMSDYFAEIVRSIS